MIKDKQKWLKYDLHLHSQYSNEDRTKEMSVEDYVNTLINKKIDVFSVTDHDTFSTQYYNKILTYIKDKNIKCIYGAELNVYLQDEKGKFQSAFYFSSDSNITDIELAISELYKDRKPLFSEIIDKFNEKKLTFIIVPEADKSGGIREIWNKLDKSESNQMLKNGMQKIFRAYDSSSSFNKTSADMWALEYFKATTEFEAIIKDLSNEEITHLTANISQKIKSMGRNQEYKVDEKTNRLVNIIIEYGKCFSYFHFSDWHNKEEYDPKFYNYIYGTFDLPFETLELAVLDPSSRIDVVAFGVEKDIPNNYIKSVHFNMNKKEYNIDFGLGLNAVIGKRASGKSLLMAVLLYLVGNEKKLSEYKKNCRIDESSIYCETFGGYKVTRGQLSSTEYIEQDTINNIFKDPSLAANSISKNFPVISSINFNSVILLKTYLKKIEKFNYNFKSFSSYIKTSNRLTNYEFLELRIDGFEEIKDKFLSIKNDFLLLTLKIKQFGFSDKYIKNVTNELIKSEKIYNKMHELYINIVDNINLIITKVNSETNDYKMIVKQARDEYKEAKSVITNNFSNILNYKKAKHIYDHLNIKIPEIVFHKKSKYLFVTGYITQGNSKDIILEKIFDSINRKKLGTSDIQFSDIYKYMNGQTDLRSGITDMTNGLKEDLLNSNYIVLQKFYELRENIKIEKIKDFSELDQLALNREIEDISESSLGRRSILYLELMLDLDQSILLFDQPEDNVDNNYISDYFVPLIKEKKKTKQLIFVTHNPSVAVYADAFNYIYAKNDKEITYNNYVIERPEDKEIILNILDGGEKSFSNRNQKYGNIIGEYKYGTNSITKTQ